MTAPKKAAAKLGPDAPSAGTGQPPWAMVAPNGTDLYFPTTAENAQAFAREFNAQPVSAENFPWPSILDNDGKIDLGNGADDEPTEDLGDDNDDAPIPSDAPEQPQSKQGGPTDQPAAPTPPAKAQPARRASRTKAESAADPDALLSYCPTPGICFPLGLPANVSHVACVHGSSS